MASNIDSDIRSRFSCSTSPLSTVEDVLVRLEEWVEENRLTPDNEIPALDDVDAWRKAHPDCEDELLRQWQAIREISRLVQSDQGRCPYPEIPDCTIVRELGAGGMSIVYEARQRSLGRIVAAKLLLNARFAAPSTLERLRREAATVAGLKHPAIVEIYATGEVENLPYLLLEYVDGGTLRRQIAQSSTLPSASAQREVARLVAELARAVDYMHQHGVIHRDLKPTNVLLTSDGRVKIADFGLAKLITEDTSLTLTGETPGTPSYMAPEQARGGEVGVFCDIYALGAILYELLCGVPPFRAETSAATLTQVLHDDVQPLRRRCSTISRDLEAICLQCLKKHPDERYHSARALADDLNRWLSGVPTHARPLSPVGRFVSWSRKRPALAALGAVILLAIATTTGLSLRHNRILGAAVVRATELQHDAEISEQAMRQQHYVATVAQAKVAWEQENAASVLALLERLVPQEGETDLRGFEWDYLWTLVNRASLTFKAHDKPVNVIRYFPDGERMITGADEADAKIWDTATGELLHTVAGHQYSIDGIEFPQQGDWFVTSSCDGSVRAWDGQTYAELWKLQFDAMTDGLAISADGTKLAVGLRFERRAVDSDEETVFLFDVATRERIDAFSGYTGTIADLKFSPDGRWLACACGDGEASIWDLESGQKAYSFSRERHASRPSSLAFAQNGHCLLIGRVDGLKYWRFDRDWEMDQVLSNCGKVGDLATSTTGQLAVAVLADHSVRIRPGWNKPERTLKGHTSGVNAVAFSPTADQVAAGAVDGTIKTWHTNATSLNTTYPHRGTAVFNPSVTEFAQCEFQKNIDRRSLEGKWRDRLKGSFFCNVWAYSSTGNKIIVCGADSLVAWDLSGDATARHPHARIRYDNPAVDVAFSGDDRLVALVQRQGIKLLDWKTRSTVWQIDEVTANLEALAMSPDGSLIAVLYGCGGIELRYVSDGSVLARPSPAHEYMGSPWPIGRHAVEFSPSGRLLAVGGRGRLRIWETSDWQIITQVKGITCDSAAVAFSADEKTIAVGGSAQLRLYQVATGQEMLRFELDGSATSVKFSPDGQRLVCDCDIGGGKSVLHVWDLGGE